MRTIPSAVLGEYLADVYRFEAAASAKLTRDDKLAPCKVKGQGLGPSLAEWFGQEVAEGYWTILDRRAQALPKRRVPYPFIRVRARHEVEVTAPKAERPKPKRNDAAYNERRMRDALIAKIRQSGWVQVGIRELAREAGMPHRTARTVLARMAADGQVRLDTSWGQGKPTGVHPLLDHPAWSGYEYAQQRAKSRVSPLVRR
jgi:hypothetical protein